MRVASLFALTLLLPAVRADARFGAWNAGGCEPPAVFYSSAHELGRSSCCANVGLPSIGVCPGGSVCGVDGTCQLSACSPGSTCPKGNPCPADGICRGTCAPVDDPLNASPNVVLITSDDQGACHFGFAGSCRTDREGRPVPAPYTPALDRLAAQGKVFTVAHNSAPWCFPSLDTIITGRLPPQRRCADASCRPPGARGDREPVGISVPTLAQLLATAGPGYCSYQVGKGTGAGFDASRRSRRIGRTDCTRCGALEASGVDPVACQFDPALCPDPHDASNPACAAAPRCGEDVANLVGDPGRRQGSGDVDEFLKDLIARGNDGKSYLPKKFFVWFGPKLPHVPTKPADTIEHRPHPTGTPDASFCTDFLFGYLCDAPAPGTVRVLGPRFPFGAPEYAGAFRRAGRRSRMEGLYGNLYWLDSAVGRIRGFLASHSVETPTGPTTLASQTVVMFLSDNGAFLPRAKKHFTENGYRTALMVYDPRHETPSGGEFRVERELAHAMDVVPTVLSYAGATPPPEIIGKDLRGWVEDPAPSPVRDAMCGTDIRSVSGTDGRYIVTRGGVAGQCSASTGGPCADDGGCDAAAGELCTQAGTCAVPGAKPCVDDDDCRVAPTDAAVCVFQERRWCSNGPVKACVADADCRAAGCRTCSGAPSRTCVDDGDCAGGLWGSCVDAPDGRACVCGSRLVKLYQEMDDGAFMITDVLRDPDETSLDPSDGSAIADARGAQRLGKLAHRLRCCMDKWWTPRSVTPATCPDGCDARVDCTR